MMSSHSDVLQGGLRWKAMVLDEVTQHYHSATAPAGFAVYICEMSTCCMPGNEVGASVEID